ncbi:MAG TPA: IS110 family transposase [Candidatus Hydrogenedentes bacterium]|nr:IS110 family transposase [Candidatus Hydrogenedentota bacterium]
MDIVNQVCAGLDVHKQSVSVCVRKVEGNGKVSSVVREFSTMTEGILQMGDWMALQGVKRVAMESTGVYWKPIWNLLEDRFELMLCNARDVKNVPGRKTDTKDCQWLVQLLQYGLLSGSFIPPRPQRELRDLTRHRAQLTGEHTRVANRMAKTLEDANIKLASVASDILGKSGRLMLEAIIAGQTDSEQLADLAQHKMRGKIPELKKALLGRVNEHHRFMLQMLFDHLAYLEKGIDDLERRIQEVLSSDTLNKTPKENDALPFDQAVTLLSTIPGVDACTAASILAETGTDMKQFPSPAHLASWAGVCPGNNESAGKRKSGKTTHGNRWLKRALSQAAWAASHTKNTYLNAQYHRIAHRRGRKRAVVSLSHTLLTIIYQLLYQQIEYCELGPDFLNTIDPKNRLRYHKKQIEKLGFKVTLEIPEMVA